MTAPHYLTLDLETHGLDPASDSWWAVRATCPKCGSALEHVTTGRPHDAGTHLAAIVQCTTCTRHNIPARYQLTTTLENA